MTYRCKHEELLRETVPPGEAVLGYGRGYNRLDTRLRATCGGEWCSTYIKLAGNCTQELYACMVKDWPKYEKHFDRPWEAQPELDKYTAMVDALECLKRENRVLTEHNVHLTEQLIKHGVPSSDSYNYHYQRGYEDGKKSGKNEMEHKRGRMQSQRDRLAKVLGDIVQLTPAEVRKIYLREGMIHDVA